MKKIVRIARLELNILFYSPIAWFLLIVFLFQCGLAYTNALENPLTTQELGGRGLRYLVFLTQRTFAPPFGVFSTMTRNLYLYLPLLTMGLMSREISSGTIRLLYSSPIKVSQIIFGKFLAMMIYNLLLIVLLAVVAVFALVNIRSADAGLLFSGLLGIYLLLCAYSAIGLFMSCLTAYQVVAALSTLVLLAALSYIGAMWQDIDFVRDLTYFLSISGRAEHMMSGLITTKDILYFWVIIYMFLGFSIYKLQSGRESKPALVKAGRYILITVSGLAVGYVTSRPGLIGYLDVTATKSRTLTVNAQKIIKETGDEPLEVTTYMNLLDSRFWYGLPNQRNTDLTRWEPYLRFKPGIRFNYVYYYDSVPNRNLYKYNPGMSLKALAERYALTSKMDLRLFKTPAEIRKMVDLSREQGRYVMQLRYKDRTTFLRLFDDPAVFPSETETGAALKRLLQAKMPKIAFLGGELERSIDKAGDRHYKILTNEVVFRYSLVNQGFDVETISLKDQDIPKDIATLVIADPKVSFDTASLMKIQQYIAAGGNLLLAGEPGKQAVLNPILQSLGVQMMDGMLVQPNKDFSPELIQPFLTPAVAALTKGLHKDAEDSLCVTMRGAAALSYNTDGPFTVIPFLMTDGKFCWNKKVKPNEEEIESTENRSGPVMSAGQLTYSPAEGDQNAPLPAVIGLTRTINGKQQRIVVAGDADFLSNAELGRTNLRACNFDFSTALFSWFSYGEFPIDTSRPKGKDNGLSLTNAGMTSLRILLLGILPGFLLLGGTVLLIRRKRK